MNHRNILKLLMLADSNKPVFQRSTATTNLDNVPFPSDAETSLRVFPLFSGAGDMKIATIVGARPQFIKASALSRKIDEHPGIEEIILHTGQHFDMNMSRVFFEELAVRTPKYNLGVHSLSHGAMMGRMLEKIEEVLFDEKPDMVLVYGDTNTTLAGALAARKLHITVAHIEAGLRSFNMRMPEEINRILSDQIADLLFCPTSVAVENLKQEGVERRGGQIHLVGDVMYDVSLYYSSKVKESPVGNSYILCTLHRQENVDSSVRLSAIVDALNEISEKMQIVLPLHPRTKDQLNRMGLRLAFEPLEPVGYLSMVHLLKYCDCVLTDSGGLQKEAYFFRKPCLTMRDETEWVELVDAGVNQLVGADRRIIVEQVFSCRGERLEFDLSLYGNGNAAQLILEKLLDWIE